MTPEPIILEFEHIHDRMIRLLKALPKENLYHIDEEKIPAFLRIDFDESALAAYLPVQRFVKAGTSKVWADSRGMI